MFYLAPFLKPCLALACVLGRINDDASSVSPTAGAVEARTELDATTPPRDDLFVHPRLLLRSGWARVSHGSQVLLLTSQGDDLLLEAPFFLELGAQSEVELAWPSGAQVRLTGTTGLEMQALDGRGLAWSWRFRRLAVAEFDIRRGAHTLTLPRAQTLLPRRGMFRLEGTIGGAVRVEHRAGETIELDVGGRYTFELPVGLRRRLPERLTVAPASYRSAR